MKKLTFLLVCILTIFSCEKDDSYTPVEDPYVVAEFRPTLSELNLFKGNLSDLNFTSRAFEYSLNSTLFTDYSNKQRLIALPENTAMQFDGDGLPIFPNNTVIAKTFYYNLDDRNLSLGKTIIETRILIKINGEWETGDYKWNDLQNDAVLDLQGSTVPVTWIDENGQSNSVNYKIPSDNQCFTCHRTNESKRPIGLNLRSLNFVRDGVNQLQEMIDRQYIEGITDASSVSVLPKWDDAVNYSLEERARAYLDINCAHCHTSGGYCELQSTLRLSYETSIDDSNIVARKNSMLFRVSSDFQDGLTMPWIGTTVLHDEGVDLIVSYLNSL
jgi:uncharacterized repeat protein (TIGR03806 family)